MVSSNGGTTADRILPKTSQTTITLIVSLLLFIALREARGINSSDQVTRALALNDEFAVGKRVEHLSSILHSTPTAMNDLSSFQTEQDRTLEELHLEIRKEPVTVQAKGQFLVLCSIPVSLPFSPLFSPPSMSVLQEPTLTVKGERAKIRNGKWNQDRKFDSPAALESFAVIDFCNFAGDCMIVSDGINEP